MSDENELASPSPDDSAGAPAEPALSEDRGDAPASRQPVLTALEARILGVLVEKQLTVPDTYPLSLNALKAGCNQKNNRDPVLSVGESELAAALDELRARSLVIESSGSRTLRYEQNLRRVLDVAGAAVPLLATLMLRGPQTAAELRLNTERMQRFADASSVEGFLGELAAHPRGALVVELPRRPGERERRWMHRLVPDDPRLAGASPGDETAAEAWAGIEPGAGTGFRAGAGTAAGTGAGTTAVAGSAPGPDAGRVEHLEGRIAALEARLDDLQKTVDALLEHIERPKQRWG